MRRAIELRDAPVALAVSRPGVQVRARRRYVAPPRNAGAESSRARLDEALESGLPIGGLELEGTAVPVARSAGGKLGVVVTLTTRSAFVDDIRGDALDYGIAAIDNDGRVLALTRGSRSIARPESLPSGPMSAPVSIHDVIDVPRREISLRGAVWSRALQRVGSVHINLSVPDLETAQSDGTVAGVILGRRSPVVASGTRGWLPFEPTTLRSFRQSDEIEIATPIFLARPDAEITVTLAVRAGGEEVARSRLVATEQASVTSQDRLFIGSLPLAALTPGDYTVSVVATDSRSRVSQRATTFAVR